MPEAVHKGTLRIDRGNVDDLRRARQRQGAGLNSVEWRVRDQELCKRKQDTAGTATCELGAAEQGQHEADCECKPDVAQDLVFARHRILRDLT